jgi:RNA polymerase sigma-70 factor (ECF subfamily)
VTASESGRDTIRKALQGDNDAFYLLMQEHKAKLYRIALTYLKNEHDALEAVQETTYRAYIGLGKLREPAYFGTWLVRLLLNVCLDELRARRRQADLFATAGDASDAADEINRLVERVGLEAAIRRIDPKYRAILHLKYFEDLTVADIARTLAKPEGTVKTWLHKALSGLRSALAKEGERDA